MTTPIAKRGESQIIVGKELIKLKVSYQTLLRIEAKLGGLAALFMRISKLDVRLGDLATLLEEMSAEAGGVYTHDQLAEMLFEAGGLTKAMDVLKPLLDAVNVAPKASAARGEATGAQSQ